MSVRFNPHHDKYVGPVVFLLGTIRMVVFESFTDYCLSSSRGGDDLVLWAEADQIYTTSNGSWNLDNHPHAEELRELGFAYTELTSDLPSIMKLYHIPEESFALLYLRYK